MPPLTLEQVLARSMRLPRRDGSRFGTAALSSMSAGVSPRLDAREVLQRGNGVPSLFSLLEKRDEAMSACRPSIHQSNNLIRNSQDLLVYLQAAKRMCAWEDALKSFSDATKVLSVKQLNDGGTVLLSFRQQDSGGFANSGSAGVTANVAHLTVLLDTCAVAKQWHLVEQLGEIFRCHTPQVLTNAVALLANTQRDDVAEGPYGWRRAIQFLRNRIPLEEQNVDAYNVCLSACEEALDWEGAITIVRLMGPNPVHQLDMSCVQWSSSLVSAQEDGEATFAVETSLTSSVPQEDADGVTLQPPQPNVVTYATLLSVLDQSGREKLACEVLQCLPSLEKEEITAAYAALIHVWSEQKCRQRRRRF